MKFETTGLWRAKEIPVEGFWRKVVYQLKKNCGNEIHIKLRKKFIELFLTLLYVTMLYADVSKNVEVH